MRSKSLGMALLLVALVSLSLMPRDSVAQTEEPVAVESTSGYGEGVYDESRWGVLAAVGCGFMVRATIVTGGAVVGTIAGAVATCGFMLFDAIFL